MIGPESSPTGPSNSNLVKVSLTHFTFFTLCWGNAQLEVGEKCEKREFQYPGNLASPPSRSIRWALSPQERPSKIRGRAERGRRDPGGRGWGDAVKLRNASSPQEPGAGTASRDPPPGLHREHGPAVNWVSDLGLQSWERTDFVGQPQEPSVDPRCRGAGPGVRVAGGAWTPWPWGPRDPAKMLSGLCSVCWQLRGGGGPGGSRLLSAAARSSALQACADTCRWPQCPGRTAKWGLPVPCLPQASLGSAGLAPIDHMLRPRHRGCFGRSKSDR